MIPMDLDFTAKQEGTRATDKATSSTSTATTTSSWSRLKDPRIVRVSRAFGGKDRHSKVCTVKGLRDRRVRLSVPTAIQLYDLQERLGLNQPSKVVDWLLNAAKSEIDELPPLQIPPEMLQSLQPMMMISSTTSPSQNDHHFSASQNDDPSDGNDAAANNWSRNDEEENEITRQYYYNNFLSRSSVLQNPSSFSSMVNTGNAAPYNNSSFLRWEYPSNLTLSQPPISLGLASAQIGHDDQDLQNFGRFVQFQPYNSADLVPSQNNNAVSEQNRHHDPRFS